MADVNFDCPQCGQNLDAPEELIGMGIDCPACGRKLEIPKPVKSAFRVSDARRTDDGRIAAPPVSSAPLKPDEESGEAPKSATVRIDVPEDFTPPPKKRIITIKRMP